ncbi:MAG: hypothetical protein ACPGVA_06715 [Pikeienuella sp.]
MFDDINLWLLAAAALSFATLIIHVFVGGPEIAAPVDATDALSPVVRATNFYCWHIVTITIAGMTAAYGLSAQGLLPGAAMLATAYALGFTGWSVALIIMRRLPWLEMGQWVLFGPITVLGVIGLV